MYVLPHAVTMYMYITDEIIKTELYYLLTYNV